MGLESGSGDEKKHEVEGEEKKMEEKENGWRGRHAEHRRDEIQVVRKPPDLRDIFQNESGVGYLCSDAPAGCRYTSIHSIYIHLWMMIMKRTPYAALDYL